MQTPRTNYPTISHQLQDINISTVLTKPFIETVEDNRFFPKDINKNYGRIIIFVSDKALKILSKSKRCYCVILNVHQKWFCQVLI
jgi:hypothetical protein